MKVGLDTLVLGRGEAAPCVYIVKRIGDDRCLGVFVDHGAAAKKADEVGGSAHVDTVAVDTSRVEIWDEDEEE